MRIEWSPLALERVAEIASWIAADHPDAAERLVDAIFAGVGRLTENPESGRVVPELGRHDIREVIHRGYRIIYHLQSDTIEILTIRHSRQLLDKDDLESD